MWENSSKRAKSDYIEVIGCPRTAVNSQNCLAISIYQGNSNPLFNLPKKFENRCIHISLPLKTGKGKPYVTDGSMHLELIADFEALMLESRRFCDHIEIFAEKALYQLITSTVLSRSYPFTVKINTY